MAKLEYGVSPTSVVLRVKLMNSSVTTGAGLTGLSSSSSGLIISTLKIGDASATTYTVAGSTIESITTLGTYAAPSSTKCRFKEVDATNHPGVYELQFADARMASTGSMLISISGATNLAQADIEIQCTNRPANITQIDGQATSGNNATLNLKQLNVVNSAGDAIIAQGGGSGGDGIVISGDSGIQITSSANYGININTIKEGLNITSGSCGGSYNAVSITGYGTGAGMRIVGGATANGVEIQSGVTSGDGMYITGANGMQLRATAGCGLLTYGEGTNNAGIRAEGSYSGSSIYSDGIFAMGCGGGNGIDILASAEGSGIGLRASAPGGDAVQFAAGTNSNGLRIFGNGSGNGVYASGGATGDGIKGVGGATSGNGLFINSPTLGHGLSATSTTQGHGISASGGGTTGCGMILTRGGASGYDFKGSTPTTNFVVDSNVLTIANNAITAAAIATGAVDADAIADNAIDAGSIATGAITNTKFASGAIDAAAIAADAIGASEFAQAAADKVWTTAARTVTAATNITSTGAAVPITAGGYVNADMAAISTDTTAANNLEAQFDGTGVTGDTYPARQDQLSNIVATGAAINAPASSFLLTTGVQASGTYANTVARDGVIHQLQDTAGTLDAYYEFDISGVGVPTGFQVYMANTGTNDTIRFFGWNWITSAWVELASKVGTAGITYSSVTIPMYSSMVGTGGNLGKVRVRLYNTGLSTANVYVDQIFVSYAIVNQSVGYSGGAIWVDSTNGSAGTTIYLNGTADKPVNTWANALTIAAALNIYRFNIAPATQITATADCKRYALAGKGWKLAMAGYDFSYATIDGCELVTGIATAADWEMFFWNCQTGAITVGEADFHNCHISDVVTLGAAAPYLFNTCCGIPIGTSGVDFGTAVGASSVVLGDCSGKWTIANMKTGDVLIATGNMELVLLASCTGGTVYIDGCINLTNSGSGQTIYDSSRYGEDSVVDAVWDEILTGATHNISTSAGRRLRQVSADIVREGIAQGPGTNGNQIQLDSGASSTNGAYDPSLIAIVGGTGTGQCRLILEYSGSNRMATVDRDWKTAPASDSEFIIYAHPGREHVNEGLAQAGGSSSITLNANASALTDNYVGQLVFIRSGTGQDQVRVVSAYNGSTKVATVSKPWGTTPDTTSAYVMLPFLAADGIVDANMVSIDGSTSAAVALGASANTIVSDTIDDTAFSPTVTEFEVTTIADADANHYKDRWVIFTSGPLQNQARAILGYGLMGGRGHFIVGELTQVPANGDGFVIV